MIKICFTKKDYVNKKDYTVWEKDYLLVELGPRGMFSEYLEMCKIFLCRQCSEKTQIITRFSCHVISDIFLGPMSFTSKRPS